MHVHGGGPAIVRDELEIYSKDVWICQTLIRDSCNNKDSFS